MQQSLIASVGLPLATFVITFLSAVLPLIHAEAYLVAVSALTTGQDLVLLTMLAALGQMLGKSVIYAGGRGILVIRRPRLQEKIARWRARVEAWKHKPDLLCLVSAASGFPPFMIVAVLAGTLQFSFRRFFLFGTVGRLIRFGLALGIPQLIKHWSA